jgi:hypothetical protein
LRFAAISVVSRSQDNRMNFEDRVFVRLADATTRSPLFDQPALEQIVTAAYDVQVQGPFNALFDDFEMGFALPQQGVIEGMWGSMGSADRVQARLLTANLGGLPPARIDALWRGVIVGRVAPANSRITAVETERPDLEGIDEQIIAEEGALPPNPDDLEQERRERVLARLRASLGLPDAFTDDTYDRWLATVGAASTGDLLARFRTTTYSNAVRVAFAPPEPVTPTPVRLPITAALLVRDSANLSVSRLLAESKLVAERLQDAGLETPRDPGLRPRRAAVVIWMVPADLFDDADWPGDGAGNAAAQRAARRAAAGVWLAREGIGLVTVA